LDVPQRLLGGDGAALQAAAAGVHMRAAPLAGEKKENCVSLHDMIALPNEYLEQQLQMVPACHSGSLSRLEFSATSLKQLHAAMCFCPAAAV
jgi:hypothetical protein